MLRSLLSPGRGGAFEVNVTGWPRGLEVTGGGQGVVSHAGLALLRHLADKHHACPGARMPARRGKSRYRYLRKAGQVGRDGAAS